MAIFEIYLSPTALANIDAGKAPELDRLDQLKTVRDDKSIYALIFPALWLVYHRLWIELGIYCCIAFSLALFFTTSIGQNLALLSIFPGLYLFLEGNNLLRTRLERNGWKHVAVTEAHTSADAELKFLLEAIDPKTSDTILGKVEITKGKTNLIHNNNDTPEFGMFSQG